MPERRGTKRRNFSYYMRVLDETTQQILGYLSDISPEGFRLDSQTVLPVERDFHLKLDLTPDVAEKPTMMFTARSKWCKVDPTDPFVYNVGFELTSISPMDAEIFRRIVEKYGSPESRW